MTKHQDEEKNMTQKTNQNNDFDIDYPNLSKMSPEEFYRTYHSFMLGEASKEKIDHHQIDLVVDDVMLKIFVTRKFHFDPKKSPFRPYLATVVRNACRSLKRRERRYYCLDEDELVALCEINGASARDKALEAREIRQWIDQGIEILRQEVRSKLMVDVFVMALIGNERPKDVARKMNVSPDYVSLAKNRCLPRLREILKRTADNA